MGADSGKKNAYLQLSGIGWGDMANRKIQAQNETLRRCLPESFHSIPSPSLVLLPSWQHDTARPGWVGPGFPLRGLDKGYLGVSLWLRENASFYTVYLLIMYL